MANNESKTRFALEVSKNPAGLSEADQNDAIVELRGQILAQAVPDALRYLADVAKGAEKGERQRVDACKTLLDRSGLSAVPPAKAGLKPSDVESMTPDQLEMLLRRGREEMARRAKPVNAPIDAQVPPKKRGRPRKNAV